MSFISIKVAAFLFNQDSEKLERWYFLCKAAEGNFCLCATIKEKAPYVEAEQMHNGAESGAEVRAL